MCQVPLPLESLEAKLALLITVISTLYGSTLDVLLFPLLALFDSGDDTNSS